MVKYYDPLSDAEKNNKTNFFLSGAAGILSGLIKVPEGVFSLAAELFDLGADTDTAAEINVDLTADVNSAGIWQDTNSTGIRLPYAFVQDAILFEVNTDMTTKISERADKSFNYYAYMKAEFGAVRMEEEKVIAIACKENA